MSTLEVRALTLGGRPLGLASLAHATLHRSGEQWVVDVTADWDSDLAAAVRRGDYSTPVQLVIRTEQGVFTGAAAISYAGARGLQVGVALEGVDELLDRAAGG